MRKKHKPIFLHISLHNFPHFRHDIQYSADIQYLKLKLSGQVVTPLGDELK